ncbi:DUF2141 domain-containing protein [Altericista sp. CCNU0014]|uniref:DUF2141 domain-containing protein n=1 Tax=Altericista sp. CCNU0014 TaxID=3082949 RepID=UPI00385002AC
MANFKHFSAVGSFITIASALLLTIPPARGGYSSNLEVKLNSLKNTKGRVCLTVFSGPKGFPAGGKGSSLKASRCIAANSGTVTFTNLPLGNYAIAAIHDSNSDGKLNTNRLGLPAEGFGFSNNPPLRYGPASFSDSQVFVSGTKTVVQIQMRYL